MKESTTMINQENQNDVQNNKVTRAEFLKKTALGAAAVAVAVKFGGATEVLAKETVSDTASDRVVGAVPPIDKTKMWIDTSNGNGVLKYWNGSNWVPTVATWG